MHTTLHIKPCAESPFIETHLNNRIWKTRLTDADLCCKWLLEVGPPHAICCLIMSGWRRPNLTCFISPTLSICLSIPSSISLVSDSFYDTFHTTADMMYFCQMMAVIEIINPLLGLVKTGFFPAMLQVWLILRKRLLHSHLHSGHLEDAFIKSSLK